MMKPVIIGDILCRIKRPICLDPVSCYKLVTVKLYHKGVVLREEKLGADIKSKMYQIKEGDFILSGIDARNGAFGIVPPELDGAVVTNDFWYFEIDDEVVDKNFFLELTATTWFDDICRKGSDGTTQRIRLQKGKFFNQTIYLPDLTEQRILSKRFQAIKSREKLLSSELVHQQMLLKKLRQQILQEAIEGKLTAEWRSHNPDIEPASELLKRIAAEKAELVKAKKIKPQKPLPPIKAEEKPFDLPQGWEWCRFQDEAEICSNLVSPYDYYDLPHIAPNHIEKNTGKLLPYKSAREDKVISGKHLFYTGQLLYSKVRPQLNKVAFAPCKGLCSADMYPIETYVNPSYLQKVMLSQYFLDQVNRFDNRVKMPKINQNQLSSIIIPCPPSSEQQAIVAKVEKLLTLCDQLETQITQNQTHAQQLMQAVLKEAFNPNSQTP